MADWRLTLDVPYDFVIEPGYRQAKAWRDFSPGANDLNNCVQDPVTGLIMLTPSAFSRDYAVDMRDIGGFRLISSSWIQAKRSIDQAKMLANQKPVGDSVYFLNITNVNAALIAIDAYANAYDDLQWAMQTTDPLIHDCGFVIHYNHISDQMIRKNNWFGVQWDDCYLHFSMQGVVTAYQYNDRNDPLTSGYRQVDQFQIASPGDLIGADGYFWIIPVPGVGILVYNSKTSQKQNSFTASVNAGSIRGHLIKWPTRTIDGVDRLFENSLVSIALNPYFPVLIGFQDITYPSAGTFKDAVFDPQFSFSNGPSDVLAFTLPTEQQGNSAVLLSADGNSSWSVGNRQARVGVTLFSTDARRTPFLWQTGVAWNPVMQTRDTTPVVLSVTNDEGVQDLLTRLEWTEDELSAFEGTADMVLNSSLGQKIAERGDSTFLLERSENGGGTWLTVFGGFAKEWEIDVIATCVAPNHVTYQAKCKLKGMEERFLETHRFFNSAFDGQSVGNALDAFLLGAQMPQLAVMPAALSQAMMPAIPEGDGNARGYRFAPRRGDNGKEIVKKLLLFVKRQGVEWRLRWDWDAATFVVEEKPHDQSDEALWKLGFVTSYKKASERKWYISVMSGWKPIPPEANVVSLVGTTQLNSQASAVVTQPLTNVSSLHDNTSIDYLGRIVHCEMAFAPLSNIDDLNPMARRVYDAIANHRDSLPVTVPDWQPGLVPNLQVQIIRPDDTPIFTGWIKKRSVVIEASMSPVNAEQTTLELDTVWEQELG